MTHSGLSAEQFIVIVDIVKFYCSYNIVLCRVCFALGQPVGSSQYPEYKCDGCVSFSPARKTGISLYPAAW